MAHWLKDMGTSFKAGQYIDQKALDRLSIIIIGAAIMNTESSSSRVMSCLAETAISVGITEEEVKHLPYSIAAIVWGFNGITPLESKIGLFEEISPGYSFSAHVAEWFDTNIIIISEQLNSELRSEISVLKD